MEVPHQAHDQRATATRLSHAETSRILVDGALEADTVLNPRQQRAAEHLRQAEQTLADYRSGKYAHQEGDTEASRNSLMGADVSTLTWRPPRPTHVVEPTSR
jgi:hypothetical protein